MSQPTVYANKVIIQNTGSSTTADNDSTSQHTVDNAINTAQRTAQNFINQSEDTIENNNLTLTRIILYFILSPVLIPLLSIQIAYNITRRVLHVVNIDLDAIVNTFINIAVSTAREIADLIDGLFHTNVAAELQGKYYKNKGYAKGQYAEYKGEATGAEKRVEGEARDVYNKASNYVSDTASSVKQQGKQASTGLLGLAQSLIGTTIGYGVSTIYYAADTVESLAPQARRIADRASDKQSQIDSAAQRNQSQGNTVLSNATDKLKASINSAQDTVNQQKQRVNNNVNSAVQPQAGELQGKYEETKGQVKGKYNEISGSVQGNGPVNTISQYARQAADWAQSQSSVSPGQAQSGLLGAVENATGNILSTAGSIIHSVADKADQIQNSGVGSARSAADSVQQQGYELKAKPDVDTYKDLKHSAKQQVGDTVDDAKHQAGKYEDKAANKVNEYNKKAQNAVSK